MSKLEPRAEADGYGAKCPIARDADDTKPEGAFGRVDFVIAALVAAATVGVFLLIVATFGDTIARLSITGQFLESDGYRIVTDMLDPGALHLRLVVHPLFSLLTMPFARTLTTLGASRLQAVWICNAAAFGAAVALLYTIQRLLGTSRRAAVLVCALSLSSSSMLFWMTVPETYPIGALSLMTCFVLAAAAARGPVPNVWLVAVGVFSLGVTITNWGAGIILAALFRPPGKAAKIVAATILIAATGWGVEKALLAHAPGKIAKSAVFPSESQAQASPRGVQTGESTSAVVAPRGSIQKITTIPSKIMKIFYSEAHYFRFRASFSDALAGELVHPVVAPFGRIVRQGQENQMYSFQGGSTVAGGPVAVLAAVGWLIVLTAGVAALVRGPAPRRFRLMLGAVLAAQIALHLVYGEETFLYALHFWVLLMLIAGLAVQSDRRGVVSGVVVATILLASWNNIHRLSEAAGLPVHEKAAWLNVLDRQLDIDEYLDAEDYYAVYGHKRRIDIMNAERTDRGRPASSSPPTPSSSSDDRPQAHGPEGSQDRR